MSDQGVQAMLQGIWWAVVIVGLLASGTFLTIHRPSNWFRTRAFNATGWVIIIFCLYLRSAIIVLVTGTTPTYRTFWEITFSLVFGTAIDILLIVRVVSFLRYVRGQGTRKATQERVTNLN